MEHRVVAGLALFELFFEVFQAIFEQPTEMTMHQAFITKRLGVMLFLVTFGVMMLTALVFFVVTNLTNLYPNLEKLAKTEANNRMTDDQVVSWLDRNGYSDPVLFRYGQWLGVMPGWVRTDDDGKTDRQMYFLRGEAADAPRFCGVFQGDFGRFLCV